MCVDPTGTFWWIIPIIVIPMLLSGCNQSTSDYGAASEYAPTDSTEFNCYAYALGETEWRDVGGNGYIPDSLDVDEIAEMVVEDVTELGRSIRIIESHDAPIARNEYRIALRTSATDYHFMKQHSDGSWSHKPSICKSRLIEGTNPSVVSWDVPTYDTMLWAFTGRVEETGYIENYYNSKTIYFAVTR